MNDPKMSLTKWSPLAALGTLVLLGCPQENSQKKEAPPDNGPRLDRLIALNAQPKTPQNFQKFYALLNPVCTNKEARETFIKEIHEASKAGKLTLKLGASFVISATAQCYRVDKNLSVELFERNNDLFATVGSYSFHYAHALSARKRWDEAVKAVNQAIASDEMRGYALKAIILASKARAGALEKHEPGMFNPALEIFRGVDPATMTAPKDLREFLLTKASLLAEAALWEEGEAREAALAEWAKTLDGLTDLKFEENVRASALERLCLTVTEDKSRLPHCRRLAEQEKSPGAARMAGVDLGLAFDKAAFEGLERAGKRLEAAGQDKDVLLIVNAPESVQISWIGTLKEALGGRKVAIIDGTQEGRDRLTLNRILEVAGITPSARHAYKDAASLPAALGAAPKAELAFVLSAKGLEIVGALRQAKIDSVLLSKTRPDDPTAVDAQIHLYPDVFVVSQATPPSP